VTTVSKPPLRWPYNAPLRPRIRIGHYSTCRLISAGSAAMSIHMGYDLSLDPSTIAPINRCWRHGAKATTFIPQPRGHRPDMGRSAAKQALAQPAVGHDRRQASRGKILIRRQAGVGTSSQSLPRFEGEVDHRQAWQGQLLCADLELILRTRQIEEFLILTASPTMSVFPPRCEKRMDRGFECVVVEDCWRGH